MLSTAGSSAAADLQRSPSLASAPPQPDAARTPADNPSTGGAVPPRSVLDDLSGFRLMLESALRDGMQGGGGGAVPPGGGLFDDDDEDDEQVLDQGEDDLVPRAPPPGGL